MKSKLMNCADMHSATFLPALDFGASPCNGQDSEQHRESGQALVLASRSVAPEPEKEQPTNGTCGPCSATSSSLAVPLSCSESKSPAPQLSERLGKALKLRLSRYGSMEYGQTWKLRVTPSGLRLWAQTASGRRTSGSGCTGSRTPSAGDAQRGVHPNPDKQAGSHSLNNEAALAGHPTPNTPNGGRTVADTMSKDATGKTADGVKHTASLEHCAKLAGHPTPNAIPENRGGLQTTAEGAMKRRDSGHMLNLDDSAQLAGHPTCSALDWKDTPGMAQTGTNPDGTERNRLDMLPRVAALAGHATPRVTTNSGIGNPDRACDGKSRLEDQCLGATTESTATSTAKTAGYRLNPGFSLWLMIGIPTIVDAWASCGVRAMQSCRRSRRSS